MDEREQTTDVEERWYWDRRNHKAIYPCKRGGHVIHFISVWHEDEFETALDNQALVPIEEFRRLRTISSFRENLPEDTRERDGEKTVFDLVGSFRILDDDEIDTYRENHD